MVTVSQGNSYSKISGLSANQFAELRKLLSYRQNPQSAYFSGGWVRHVSLLSKKGDFPTGLMSRVDAFLKDIPHKFYATRPKQIQNVEVDMSAGCPSPWEDQYSAVVQAMLKFSGTISMPTGTGKSLVIAMLHAVFKVRTLIVVPSLEIKKQLTEDLERYLTTTDYVTVENIDSTALAKPIWNEFDCLIIDEAHHVAAKTYHKLNKKVWNGIRYRFFLTATPFRNQSDEQLLFEAIAGELIFKLDYKTAIDKGYIVPVEAYYIEVPKRQSDAYTWKEVYSEHVVTDILKNLKISNMLLGLNMAGHSTLCLVKEVKHGEILADLSSFEFVHGSSDDREAIQRFNNKKMPVLIGTTGVLGEGVDTKPCEYVIIAGLGKAKSQFMQNVGRAVRKYPGKKSAKVILIKDRSHKFCSRHFNEQCRILKDEYGVVPIKLEI